MVIVKTIQVLGLQPGIGRPTDDLGSDFRELPIDFGSTGCLAPYRQRGDDVIILALRHPLEDDYKNRTYARGSSNARPDPR